MGFDKFIMCVCPYSIMQSVFATPKMPCVPPIHPNPLFFPQPMIFYHLRILHFLGCQRVSHAVCVALSDWLRHLNLRLSHVFSGLIGHFSLMLNNIPWSGWTTVYLSVHRLKDILIASMFWKLQVKLLWTPGCRFLCEPEFSRWIVW